MISTNVCHILLYRNMCYWIGAEANVLVALRKVHTVRGCGAKLSKPSSGS